MKSAIKHFTILFLLLIIFTGCTSEDDKYCSNTYVPDIDLMNDLLLSEIVAQSPKGFAYIITQKGKVVKTESGGLARSVTDGNLKMTPSTLMHIASISKTITSAAAFRLIKQKGLHLSKDSIYHYLPPHWKIAESTKKITFYNLMVHKVRFPIKNEGSLVYDSLRVYAERGLTTGTPEYSNINHSFFRLIIPILWDKYRPSDGNYNDAFTADVYEKYIQEEIFNPLNIKATLNTEDSHADIALAYTDKDDENGSYGAANYKNIAGAVGWQMSVVELAKFWAYLFYSEKILSEQLQKDMKFGRLGMWETFSNGKYGTYYGKAGLWYTAKDVNGDRNYYKSFVILFPYDIQVTLFINSGTINSLRTILIKAFEDSFVLDC